MKYFVALLLLLSSTCKAYQDLKTPADVAHAFAQHKPMVIMFYTTWCPACKATKPEFARLERALKGRVSFYTMDVEKLELKPAGQPGFEVRVIPSFTCGKTEQEVRSGKNFREGGGDWTMLLQYLKDSGVVQ